MKQRKAPAKLALTKLQIEQIRKLFSLGAPLWVEENQSVNSMVKNADTRAVFSPGRQPFTANNDAAIESAISATFPELSFQQRAQAVSVAKKHIKNLIAGEVLSARLNRASGWAEAWKR
ncbi:hypothetical protein [Photobacterium alginatilyticum]|uniref:Uncharacterized protein n=1 Tax=Photobacterium alginatilyticum TaxID=1775171 RepID=A0ABW9YI34_9GAMM|nr:hypothetical protein [Photobacterium alginatilyticum]NBI53446.1 hypothetical protein [Photobacterium alginatilyticum]